MQGITPDNIKEFRLKHKVAVGSNSNKHNYVNFFHPEKEKIEAKSKVLVDYTSDLVSHPELAGALSTIFSSTY